jgi:hypothetical protein
MGQDTSPKDHLRHQFAGLTPEQLLSSLGLKRLQLLVLIRGQNFGRLLAKGRLDCLHFAQLLQLAWGRIRHQRLDCFVTLRHDRSKRLLLLFIQLQFFGKLSQLQSFHYLTYRQVRKPKHDGQEYDERLDYLYSSHTIRSLLLVFDLFLGLH